MLASALRDLGLEVEEVRDGGRLLVTVGQRYGEGRTPDDIDVIVTDIRMPVLSGLQVFKGMRAAHWNTPVVLMTAFPTNEVWQAARDLNAIVMIKPLDLDDFERTIIALVARRHPSFRPVARAG